MIVELEDKVNISEYFTLSNKKEIIELKDSLDSPQFILLAVLEVSATQRLVWVVDYDIGSSDIQLDDLFDFAFESINYYSDAFQDKWR